LERPSHKELAGKLTTALGLLESGRWAPANPSKLHANFVEMDLYREEQWSALRDAIIELKPEHYCGARPPQRSYEQTTRGAEMFAFSWDSKRFASRMYLKVALAGYGGSRALYVYSFHPSRGKVAGV